MTTVSTTATAIAQDKIAQDKNDQQKKFKYHHGNLRDALLTAAVQILDTDGIDGLSLRALAKATGVTQAAPYSHFRDKEELLAAVAEGGFQRLALQMAEDATGAPTVAVRIEKLISSYIRFAVENKAMFQVMFGRELADMKKFPTLAMTAGKCYSLISSALASKDGAGDTRLTAAAVWSLCHGLTTLVTEGKIDPQSFGASGTDELVRKSVALFAGQI